MERRNHNVLIIFTGVVIVAAVLSSFGLSLFSGPTATITLPTPVPVDTSQPGEESGGENTRVEISPDTVQSVIAALSRLESYSRTITTTLEGTASSAQIWVDGGWTRSDLLLPTGRTVYTVVGEGRVWRWYDGDDTAVSWAAGEGSVDIEGQRIPTYEDVLALDKRDITAAGYEEKNGSPCVYVEVTVPLLDQVERYWVSAESGLLFAAETETGGQVVWTMTAELPEIPAPAGSFTLPDGTVLHTAGE